MGGRNNATVTPVMLNLYDLTGANDYLYLLGFSVFHSGIEGFRRDLSPCLSIFLLGIRGRTMTQQLMFAYTQLA
jgi:hypothetical protein